MVNVVQLLPLFTELNKFKEVTGNDALEVFEMAMENIIPYLGVRVAVSVVLTTKSQLKARPERQNKHLTSLVAGQCSSEYHDRLAKKFWMQRTTLVQLLRNVKISPMVEQPCIRTLPLVRSDIEGVKKRN